MPVVQLTRSRLAQIYPNRSYDEIVSMLPYLGLDIEGFNQEFIRVEYSPNRPDYSTDLGIVRGLKGLFGDELGISKRNFAPGKIMINVSEKVKNIRPHIAAFLAQGLILDEDSIKQIISMQEDLHHGVGRDRKKVAIGLHDFSAIVPPISYIAVEQSFSFIPLNGSEPMSITEILKKTDQGLKYGNLISGNVFPVIMDSKGTVLSLPPIINGNATKVSEKTSNLFVDITGIDLNAVKLTASIIAETLWDMGASIVQGAVDFQGQELLYPDISLHELKINRQQIDQLLGIKISLDQLILSLLKSRLEPSVDDEYLRVKIPHYRGDVLHPVDLVEEVMIGYGLFNIQPDLNFHFNAGQKNYKTKRNGIIRQILVGLGFSEIVNPVLTSETLLTKYMKRDARVYSVSFSKSLEHNAIRDMLLPECIKTISVNQQEPAPHKFFEIGDIVIAGEAPQQKEKLCLVEEGQNITMTSAKSYTEAINSIAFKYKLEYVNDERPYSLRSASIISDGKTIGEIGEIHPDILLAFKIKNPVIYSEFYI